MNPLTTHELDMPLTGIGTYQLRGSTCASTVRTALELGYRHIDTAQMYGNEAEVGQAIVASGVPRADIFVTTKVWTSDFRAADFISATERSLAALKTGYVDLLLLHWPQHAVPLEETLGALQQVLARGWARRGGVSNFSIAQMERALAIAGTAVSCNQVACHVGAAPAPLIAAARTRGVAITAYSPLAQGALRRDRLLTELGARYGMTAAQVALRWLTQQGIAVIPKASSRARLAENLAAQQFTLGDADINRLGRL